MLAGAYNGATSSRPPPSWLIAANVLFGLANLIAARFTDRLSLQIEVGFEALTGILILGTAYATLLSGQRHWPLASSWTLAGLLYLGVAVLHWRRKHRHGSPQLPA